MRVQQHAKQMHKTMLRLGFSHLLAASISFQVGLLWVGQARWLYCPSFLAPADVDWASSAVQTMHVARKIRQLERDRRAKIFSSSVQRVLSEASRVARDDFLSSFPLGFPVHESWQHNNEVFLLHLSDHSLPVSNPNNSEINTREDFLFRPFLNATSNCDIIHVLNVALREKGRNEETCLALVGTGSIAGHTHDIFKWVRLENVPAENQEASSTTSIAVTAKSAPSQNLTHVARYVFPAENGWQCGIPPNEGFTMSALTEIRSYLSNLDIILKELKPIANRVAYSKSSPSSKGAIIVMVTNFGHSDLFINYCCAARAAGMDLSKILLFATDQDTKDMGDALGIQTYFNEKVFSSIPREESQFYGSPSYAKIMASKIYCVHLISMLGYDVLFQDVDIIPYNSSYLEYFVQKAKAEDYDFFFQNDFNKLPVYQPW